MSRVKVDDIELTFDDTGTGPAVVLIHGYPFNRSLWNEQVEALKGKFRVITPDLRGFGDSEATSGTFTMNQMAQDVAAVMDHLSIRHAAIGGLSMGGYVALAFYKQFPERVDALILADTRPQADTAEAKQTRAQQAEKALNEGMPSIADSMLPKLLTPETVSKRPEVVKRVRDMMLKAKPQGAAAALLGMAARDDQTALLKQINVPTLILVGRDDALTPLADSELMHSEIAGSELTVIEKAGHVSNFEQTKVFNEALTRFLSEVEGQNHA